MFADRHRLNTDVVRLHIVANSDSTEDQALKLRIRDVVTEYLDHALADIRDTESAKRYIREHLQTLSDLVQDVLHSAGCNMSAEVDFGAEAFDSRAYDTFTMPAGVYDALRITIGQGEGKNWWCVVFPSLCMGVAAEDFEAEAAGAGFPDSLIGAMERETEYEIRFFLLDVLGRLENIFHNG